MVSSPSRGRYPNRQFKIKFHNFSIVPSKRLKYSSWTIDPVHGSSHSVAQYTVTRKPRHYHFSDDDRLRLHRYFGTRVGEIYVKINLKRCMNTTISGSLYSTRPPLLPFYRSANKNDVSPETLQISMLSQRWRNNSLSFSRAKKKLLCCIL